MGVACRSPTLLLLHCCSLNQVDTQPLVDPLGPLVVLTMLECLQYSKSHVCIPHTSPIHPPYTPRTSPYVPYISPYIPHTSPYTPIQPHTAPYILIHPPYTPIHPSYIPHTPPYISWSQYVAMSIYSTIVHLLRTGIYDIMSLSEGREWSGTQTSTVSCWERSSTQTSTVGCWERSCTQTSTVEISDNLTHNDISS